MVIIAKEFAATSFCFGFVVTGNEFGAGLLEVEFCGGPFLSASEEVEM